MGRALHALNKTTHLHLPPPQIQHYGLAKKPCPYLLQLLGAICQQNGQHLDCVEADVVVVLFQQRKKQRHVVRPLDKDLRKPNPKIIVVGRRA
jgi:hypothetical protein